MIVYPMKATALNVVHPCGVPLKPEGSEWPYDGFTCRMIVQGICGEEADKDKAYKDSLGSPRAHTDLAHFFETQGHPEMAAFHRAQAQKSADQPEKSTSRQ
jgi:hypothetical protein